MEDTISLLLERILILSMNSPSFNLLLLACKICSFPLASIHQQVQIELAKLTESVWKTPHQDMNNESSFIPLSANSRAGGKLLHFYELLLITCDYPSLFLQRYDFWLLLLRSSSSSSSISRLKLFSLGRSCTMGYQLYASVMSWSLVGELASALPPIPRHEITEAWEYIHE